MGDSVSKAESRKTPEPMLAPAWGMRMAGVCAEAARYVVACLLVTKPPSG